jgi:tetratricopeptide (TPR) repeat protein
MSLLMKALEKAAKDREEPRKEPAAAEAAAATAPAAAAPRSELSLEPLRPEASPAPSAPRPDAPRATAAPAPPRPVGAAAPQRETAQAQAQASTVVQAQAASRPARGAGTYLRAHPVMVLGTLAALIAIGFGVYVYLQIFHPQLFIARPAAKPGLPPLTQAPAVPVPGTPAPLPSGPLLKEAAQPAPEGAAPVPSPEAARPKPPPAVPVPAEEASPRTAVAVSRSSPEPSINPLHTQAYAALRSGHADEARQLYGQMASADPKNVDALLGLAAIAAQRGEVEEASRRYLQILELEPRHALAQSGLIALLGRADPLAAESRLRQLIAREPTAHLHFTLGNLHAEQSQWAAAQQAYFQAHHLEPANPDYAYNLAVALEHVSQPKLALGFYRRAAQLAAARGRANFSLPQVQERIGKLAAQVE